MRTGQNFKKLNNDGFTLVELVVVIAIILILTSGVAMSSKAVGNANVNQVASGIANGLARTQQLCMAKQSGYMSLYLGNSGWEVEIDGPTDKDHRIESIGSAGVWVHVYYDDGSDEELMPGSRLILSFTPSGAFKQSIKGGSGEFNKNAQGTTPETYTYDVTYNNKMVTLIQVTNTGGKVSEITIQPNTGHFEKN